MSDIDKALRVEQFAREIAARAFAIVIAEASSPSGFERSTFAWIAARAFDAAEQFDVEALERCGAGDDGDDGPKGCTIGHAESAEEKDPVRRQK